jgi:hypothetical protein
MAIGGGRRTAPLGDEEIRSVMTTFIGIDASVRTVRHEEHARTAFRVVPAVESHTGEEFGEIVFGPDIYPGLVVANPNSSLSMAAAAAHELAHYHRWFNRTQLEAASQAHLDEALTSLEAVQRYHHKLNDVDVVQLVADAHLRISENLAEGPG